MNELFTIQMSTILTVLLVMLGLCLLTVAWVAIRRPVIFKLGVRNIPRRPPQTVLIVVGLMLSTLIMAAALGVGDTFDYSLSKSVYDVLGPVDEMVVSAGGGDVDPSSARNSTIPAGTLALVDESVRDDPNVDGVLPYLLEQVPAQNTAKGQGEPGVWLAGADPERLRQVGGLETVDGEAIDLGALATDEVVVAEKTADALDAAVGDTLTLSYNNAPFDLRVGAIAGDSILAGQLDPTQLGMVIPLDRLRERTGQTDTLSFVAISNAGDDRGGVGATDAVIDKLEPALDGQGLGVAAVKQDNLDEATLVATAFTGFFLVLGLFSIAAGILLIVLIFTMLAAERRPEMGMARAVGARRSQLFQQFVAEGTGYALPAGILGALLGVGATYGIAAVMRGLFGDFFPIEARVTPRSMVVAFCLGVVITFLAVTLSSWRISRLNVVAAVRDIPDVTNPTRKKRTLLGGALAVVAGAGLILLGRDTEQLAWFTIGVSLVPFGLALVLRFFGVPSRPVFTTVGLALLVFWLMPDDLFTRIFGEYNGNFEMFFVSGIFMVLAATIVIVNNLDSLLGALTAPTRSLIAGAVALAAGYALRLVEAGSVTADVLRLAGQIVLGLGVVLLVLGLLGLVVNLFPRVAVPAVRTAISYPGAARGRTGMTIAMFSLIVFSLVMIATMSTNFSALFLGDEANAGWDVRATASDANPIDDFEGALAAQGVDTGRFAAVGEVTTPDASSRVRLAGGEFRPYPVNGMDPSFVEHAEIVFGQRAEGYADDAAIMEALRTRPDVAIIDASALEGNGDPDGLVLEGLRLDDETFAPIVVEVEDRDGAPVPLTIIGVIDQAVTSLFGFYAPRATIDPIFPQVAATEFWVAGDDPDQADQIAKDIEAALLPQGVAAVSIQDQLEEGQALFGGFLSLIQGFMGLGLVVGVAAVGVIAFRSVVERRQQIGVLRALGYQRSLVSLSFLIETGFIVLLGIASGTFLGVALARILLTSDDFGGIEEFLVPWPLISGILLATVVVSLLMAWVPSQQAARIAPAEALRYE